jgi:arabinose-5-phosphate isomerase
MDICHITQDAVSVAREVLHIEMDALAQLSQRLDDRFIQAVALLKATQGRIIVTGMGKSGWIGRKMAATFSSTGSPAYFLHPAEGSHGDLGLLGPDDVVLAISYSGETQELLGVLPVIKRLGLPMVAMTRNGKSTLGMAATTVLDISVPQEACPFNLAPTASTTVTLALGDALAVALLKDKGFTADDFALVHPAGALGRRLLFRVADVMQTEHLPLVTPDTPFLQALLEISHKRLGLALIVNPDHQLMGVLTDGDIRRALQQNTSPDRIELTQAMTLNPLTIDADAMATEALYLMEHHKITALVIVDHAYHPVGVCHLHDLLKTGIR